MADKQSQSLISILKIDGSKVRVTLDEFKRLYKLGQVATRITPAREVKVKKSTEPSADASLGVSSGQTQGKKKEDDSKKARAHSLAKSTPVKDIFVDEAKHKAEKKSKVKKKRVTQTKKVVVDPVLKAILVKLSFAIALDLLGRLKSLIDSRLKGVRTDAQILNYMQREESTGGLGLEPKQADELLKVVKQEYNLPGSEPRQGSRIPKKKLAKMREGSQAKEYKKRQTVQPKTQESIPKQSIISGEKKPILHDVTVPETQEESLREMASPKSMGPIEELENFSLIDFRRLSQNTKEAADLVRQKFLVLENESFLLFWQGKKAWTKSPIYKEYLEILKRSLGGAKELVAVTGKREDSSLSASEVKAIIKLNAQISGGF